MFKRLVKNAKAVSPIIATLMLVLIAVAAAGAFFVWETNWQKGATKNVEDVTGQGAGQTISIGGSTTVYPFTQEAVTRFEAVNPSIRVDASQGGSGAGLAAVGKGLIDIGAISDKLSGVDSTYNTKYPDLNPVDGVRDTGSPDLIQTLECYDAVVIITSTGNLHQLMNTSWQIMYEIYAINGGKITDGTIVHPHGAGGKVQWTDVPKGVNATGIPVGGNCSGAGLVNIYDRTDISGTEETFVTMLGQTKSQLEEKGITATHCNGNQGMLDTIKGDNNGICFLSYGYAINNPTLVTTKPFYQNADANGRKAGLIDPLASSFAGNVKKSVKVFYSGARECYYVTIGQPSGIVKQFIDYTQIPQNNQDICNAIGFISLY